MSYEEIEKEFDRANVLIDKTIEKLIDQVRSRCPAMTIETLAVAITRKTVACLMDSSRFRFRNADDAIDFSTEVAPRVVEAVRDYLDRLEEP
jgi:hypothetical protein